MNEILEMIAMTQVSLNETNDKMFEQLIDRVKEVHKKEIIAAFNRGRVDSLPVIMIGAESYYENKFETK